MQQRVKDRVHRPRVPSRVLLCGGMSLRMPMRLHRGDGEKNSGDRRYDTTHGNSLRQYSQRSYTGVQDGDCLQEFTLLSTDCHPFVAVNCDADDVTTGVCRWHQVEWRLVDECSTPCR